MPLTAAFSPNDRVADLLHGAARLPTIPLEVTSPPPSEIFASVCQGDGYDVAEMSLAAHLHRCGHGYDDYVGIPVFTSRAFRHGMVYVRADSDIKSPVDLNGKRIVVREWGMTALVWLIGILTDERGFDMTTVSWCSLREPRIDVKPPAPIALLPPETCVSTLLGSGEVDAAMVLETPTAFAIDQPNHEQSAVKRLFADYPELERDYWRRTRIHPPMHCVVVRRLALAQYPRLAQELFDTLDDSRQRAMDALTDPGVPVAMLPFLAHAVDDTVQMFGKNWWPYGLSANREALATLARYAHAQQLTPDAVDIENCFLDLSPTA